MQILNRTLLKENILSRGSESMKNIFKTVPMLALLISKPTNAWAYSESLLMPFLVLVAASVAFLPIFLIFFCILQILFHSRYVENEWMKFIVYWVYPFVVSVILVIILLNILPKGKSGLSPFHAWLWLFLFALLVLGLDIKIAIRRIKQRKKMVQLENATNSP